MRNPSPVPPLLPSHLQLASGRARERWLPSASETYHGLWPFDVRVGWILLDNEPLRVSTIAASSVRLGPRQYFSRHVGSGGRGALRLGTHYSSSAVSLSVYAVAAMETVARTPHPRVHLPRDYLPLRRHPARGRQCTAILGARSHRQRPAESGPTLHLEPLQPTHQAPPTWQGSHRKRGARRWWGGSVKEHQWPPWTLLLTVGPTI
jgi:hypothetical protein